MTIDMKTKRSLHVRPRVVVLIVYHTGIDVVVRLFPSVLWCRGVHHPEHDEATGMACFVGLIGFLSAQVRRVLLIATSLSRNYRIDQIDQIDVSTIWIEGQYTKGAYV